MLAQRWMWMAWPAFLAAGLVEMLVFAFVDPHDLRWFGHGLDLSRHAVYTIAFFAFWSLTMLSGALTMVLAMAPFDSHRCPIAVADRPADCAKGQVNGNGCC